MQLIHGKAMLFQEQAVKERTGKEKIKAGKTIVIVKHKSWPTTRRTEATEHQEE